MSNSTDPKQSIIDQYNASEGKYKDLSHAIASLAETLLRQKNIQVHSTTCRTKSVASLSEKLSRPGKSYSKLSDITDLAGVRITTYFADDVDRAADVVKSAFSVDANASVDKRVFSDPNRFGYRSLHYIVGINPERTRLPEYQQFESMTCEIQIRSILQHAWAEIEHDLGYKSSTGVPAHLRRKFARIASLLELADDEFCTIRDQLTEYEAEIPEKILSSPNTVLLDLPSFRALFSLPSATAKLDDIVVRIGNGQLNKSKVRRPEVLVQRLIAFGIGSIDALEKASTEYSTTIEAFASYWLPGRNIGEVDSGIGVFYLCYVLAWRTQDRAFILKYLTENSIGGAEEREDISDRLLAFKFTSAS